MCCCALLPVHSHQDLRSSLELYALTRLRAYQVLPRQRQTDESKIDVEVMVKERPMQTSEIECEWSIAPSDNGRPSLVNIVPGQLLPPIGSSAAYVTSCIPAPICTSGSA